MSATTEQAKTNKVKRRRYDEQFKRDAVALLEAGRGATQLARELGGFLMGERAGRSASKQPKTPG